MRKTLALLFMLVAPVVHSQAPAVDQALAAVVIEDRGELVLEQGEFSFRPWRSDANPGRVHVLQYFAGTKDASEMFEPFTDRLQESLDPGTYHVTTVINLAAALWGTSGFVVSEVKSSKREFPLATIVLDEEGIGASTWQLGKKGALLAIMDGLGQVRYLAREALSEEQISNQVDWIRAQIGGAGAVSVAAQ
jgi:YtfJ family uncharacterized protein